MRVQPPVCFFFLIFFNCTNYYMQVQYTTNTTTTINDGRRQTKTTTTSRAQDASDMFFRQDEAGEFVSSLWYFFHTFCKLIQSRYYMCTEWTTTDTTTSNTRNDRRTGVTGPNDARCVLGKCFSFLSFFWTNLLCIQVLLRTTMKMGTTSSPYPLHLPPPAIIQTQAFTYYFFTLFTR